MRQLKFTKTIKAKWLKALKSGKYTQGTGTLKYTDSENITKHCCLGVLCEIHPKLTIEDDNKEGVVLLNGEGYKYNVLFKMLSEKNCRTLANKNDRECDGKYTAVIDIIEGIPTT